MTELAGKLKVIVPATQTSVTACLRVLEPESEVLVTTTEFWQANNIRLNRVQV